MQELKPNNLKDILNNILQDVQNHTCHQCKKLATTIDTRTNETFCEIHGDIRYYEYDKLVTELSHQWPEEIIIDAFNSQEIQVITHNQTSCRGKITNLSPKYSTLENSGGKAIINVTDINIIAKD